MPPPKSPTIYDVAKQAGVSITTVSRMLNAPDKVTPETRERILAAIDSLGFVPKAEARARALRQTGRIGVITPFFTALSFVQRLRGVAAMLSRQNYELVIYPVDSEEQLKGYISSIPVMRNIDGLIIMSLAMQDQDVERLVSNQMETVLIEFDHEKLSCVVIDDYQGGRMAAEYLLRKGYCSFGFLGDIEPPERYAIHPVRSRLEGFQSVLQENGLTLSSETIKSAFYAHEASRQAAYELLTMPNRPRAIFAASDIQALSIIKVARQLNVRIPEDVALIGFDDIDMAEYADLTTIRQHLDESGRLAVEILMGRIADPSRPVQHIKLPLTLVERETA
ncbi:MAG: LacI family transcriptional regulator [Anaerolineae bacterium]|nr:MAG: LacI family transcriptional regulator [Anaerolineae bacterium]